MGQEATPDAIPTIVATNQTNDDVLPVDNDTDVIVILFEIIAEFFTSFGGGVVTGALTIVGAVKILDKNTQLQTSIERLALSLPPETLGILNEGFQLVRDMGQIGVNVTDGLPNEVPIDKVDETGFKPPEPQPNN